MNIRRSFMSYGERTVFLVTVLRGQAQLDGPSPDMRGAGPLLLLAFCRALLRQTLSLFRAADAPADGRIVGDHRLILNFLTK